MKEKDNKYFSFNDIINTALINPNAIKGEKILQRILNILLM